jgi:hypothetical protein
MLGEAAVAMWWDVAPERRGEWEDWHSHEHMPERLSIPGFLRGSRWVAGNSYFVLYEASSIDVLTGGVYLERLNNPTPWSRRMMPHHRNMVRSLCRVRARFGRGVGQVLATIRAETAEHALSPLVERKGITSACLLESEPMAGMPQTAEQKIRGGDAEAGWIALIGGYDAERVGEAASALAPRDVIGLYRLSYLLLSRVA